MQRSVLHHHITMPPPAAGTSDAAASASFPKRSRPKWLPRLSLPCRHHSWTTRVARPKSPLPGAAAATAGCSGGGGGSGVGNRGSTRGFSEVFRRFDTDGDGKISGAELLSFLTSAGEEVSPEDVEGVVEELDSDGDGLMDYGDFVRLMGTRGGGGGGGEEDLRAAFEMFAPEEGSGGCITPAGLRRALGRLGDAKTQEECAAMIRAFDADGNGVLDYQEFCRMMMT